MTTPGQLNDRTKKSLADMARRRGIRGWESMDKVALVKALSRPAPSAAKIKKPAKPAGKARPPATARKLAKTATKTKPKPVGKPVHKIAAKLAARTSAKPSRLPAHTLANGVGPRGTSPPAAASGTSSKSASLAGKPPMPGKAAAKPESAKAPPPVREAPPRVPSGPMIKDRIILAVNDPYWLHVMWDLSPQSVQRAEAALKQDWYGARLVIRLSDVTSQDTTSTSETPIRDYPIEGDGRNWYINVPQPPRQYRADIGYLSRSGYFFPIARSNVVTPPKAGSAEAIDAGWEKDPKKVEKIVAMSTGFESAGSAELKAIYEKKLNRPIGPPKETSFGTGATLPGSLKKFFFDINAKLIVMGRTDPTAHVTLGNDPIDLQPNGTFVMEFSLPDSRQIIPAVATSSDGVEERTIVLAVERNTKYLDPMIHDQMSEG
ncbi:MAG TPA: DUF4912 domain-containing protein [Gemmata sp.]|nr:DUF4912 domain-containing protein [Gemmata sp.]